MVNEMKVKPPREKIIRDMRKGIVEFTFTKSDGELREMRGTLVNRVIPEDKIPTTDYNSVSKANPDVIRCFDIDIKDWRSFKISTLQSYEGIKRAL